MQESSFDLLFLAFAGGFALAALIFWPLLRRARQQAEAAPSKHTRPATPRALPKPAAPSSPAGNAWSVTTTTRSEPVEQHPADQDQPAHEDVPTEPVRPTIELGDLPEMPTGLYQRNHAAQFDRTRARLNRLRAQLKE